MSRVFLLPAAKGKRVVFWAVACFLASQVMLRIYLDARRADLDDPLYALRLRQLRARLAQSPGAPLVLLLGSSRTKYGVRPAAMPVRGTPPTPPPYLSFSLQVSLPPRIASSEDDEQQHPQNHQHREGPGQQDGDNDRIPQKGVDVALDHRLDEVQARTVEIVPQLAEGDRCPVLGVDPDQEIAYQHRGACEQGNPADHASDDHRCPHRNVRIQDSPARPRRNDPKRSLDVEPTLCG